MKYLFVPFIILLGLGSLFTACGLLADENEAALENVDAIKAVEIADQWKWTKKDIKSHVTTRGWSLSFLMEGSKRFPFRRRKCWWLWRPI
jgi:hypothetical protein